MEALEALFTRRSIRKYTDEPIDAESIDLLLKAAMSAPTAAGEVWHYIVVRDRTKFADLRKIHPHSHMLDTVAAAIIICGDPTQERLPGRWVLDCAASCENILIAANAIGLGACWIGIYPVQERIECLRNSFSIPQHITPLCIVSLGRPAEKKRPPDRFRKELIHTENW